MDEQKAREILGAAIKDDGLYDLGWYLRYNNGGKYATLDGEFSVDDLEAIAWWIRRHADNGSSSL